MRISVISRLKETAWSVWLGEDTGDRQMEPCAGLDHVLHNCWVLEAIWGSADVTTLSTHESVSALWHQWLPGVQSRKYKKRELWQDTRPEGLGILVLKNRVAGENIN